MKVNRFDQISRLFSARQTENAKSSNNLAAMQEATPPSNETTNPTHTLFVQSFQSGSVTPSASGDGVFTLTLESGLGQTIYFSDRPERIVGATPTAKFLGGLGFTQDNPPNAALVAQIEPGNEDIAVLELFDPVYDESVHKVTYQARTLENWERSVELGFTEAPTDLGQLASSFGPAHLFIDDCPDGEITCVANGLLYGSISNSEHGGYCYNWGAGNCYSCQPNYNDYEQDVVYWSDYCNKNFSGCGGNCLAQNVCIAGFLCPDQ